MRREREPSINLSTYFGRTASAGVPLPVRRLTYKNLYSRNDRELSIVLDPAKLEAITFLNCINPGDPSTVFYDNTWRGVSNGFSKLQGLKKLRIDAADDDMAHAISEISGLEEFYLVNRQTSTYPFTPDSAHNSPAANPNSADKSSDSTPITPTAPYHAPPSISIASEFLAGLSAQHGHSLRILLLSNEWKFSKEAVVNLTKFCPQLEQLGLAIDGPQFEAARVFLLNVPKLWAFRILEDLGMHGTMIEMKARELGDIYGKTQEEVMGRELGRPEYASIRYFGLAAHCFELGKVIEGKIGDAVIKRRIVKVLTWDEIKTKAEIFGMDSLDV